MVNSRQFVDSFHRQNHRFLQVVLAFSLQFFRLLLERYKMFDSKKMSSNIYPDDSDDFDCSVLGGVGGFSTVGCGG